jgi:hypothetical protein
VFLPTLLDDKDCGKGGESSLNDARWVITTENKKNRKSKRRNLKAGKAEIVSVRNQHLQRGSPGEGILEPRIHFIQQN